MLTNARSCLLRGATLLVDSLNLPANRQDDIIWSLIRLDIICDL